MALFRPSTSLTGAPVVVMGLGTKQGGVGSARFAALRGARVLVTDLRPASDLRASMDALADVPVSYRLGEHRMEDFATAACVIRNETIERSNPYLRAAAASGAVVDSPAGITSALVERPAIGVTGTKGKTTTTHLVAHLLRTAGHRAVECMNNCVSPLPFLTPPQPTLVLELSSFQLRETALHQWSPHVAVWTSFFPDHMDHYQGLDDYFHDKAGITRFQGPSDHLVLPAGHPRLEELETRARMWRFGVDLGHCGDTLHGVTMEDDAIILVEGGTTTRVLDLDSTVALGTPSPILRPQYLASTLAAVAAARAFGVPTDAIRQGLGTFPGVPHRFQTIWTGEEGVVINDSAASTPQSVRLALDAAPRRPLVLIAGGGGHKGLDYGPLAAHIAREVALLVIFDDDPIADDLRAALPKSFDGQIKCVGTMDEAVATGIDAVERDGGTLLLSPGCSGAPRFVDMFDRGDRFVEAVGARLGAPLPRGPRGEDRPHEPSHVTQSIRALTRDSREQHGEDQ